jgi:hypothetical protein
MTTNQIIKTYQAQKRKNQRQAIHRQKELERQRKELHKLTDAQIAAHEVKVNENHIDLLTSFHAEASEPYDWAELQSTELPQTPEPLSINQDVARERLHYFKPSIMQKMLGKEKEIVASLQQELEAAIAKDKELHENALKEHRESTEEILKVKEIASGVLDQDLNWYVKALDHFKPYDEVAKYLTSFQIHSKHNSYLEITIGVADENTVLPKEEKTLTKSGKVSSKQLTASRKNEIYGAYVCGISLRIARETMALLPVERVIVHVNAQLLNSVTGYKEPKTILSALYPKATINQLNFDAIDCIQAMGNFKHNMQFSKTKGFTAIEILDSAINP